ncbi:MAG: IscS subfamily cysteine desulfurase [Ignavibacteriaceae bacterium]
MKLPIYLDNHATTPLDPEVFEVMKPYLLEKFGNASSKHSFGFEADAAVKYARENIAKAIGAAAKEIYFTSGTTESINLVHFGIAQSYYKKGKRIITSAVEHSASLDSLKHLEQKGFDIVYLPVNKTGLIDTEELKSSINNDTILVTIIAANNEIGTIQDIKEIGNICREKNVFFHTDAAQAIGKISFNLDELNVDMISFSAHKIYGTKGIGALYVRSKNPAIKLEPQILGGGHENGLRSGTLNVPAIAGFGKAAELFYSSLKEESGRIEKLRDMLYNGIISELDGVHLNSSLHNGLPGNLNLSFEGVKAETLLTSMREIAVSTGSACTSASLKPSHVLKAIGLSDDLSRASVRFGIGRFNTQEEIRYTIDKVVKTVKELRQSSPLYKIKEITTN